MNICIVDSQTYELIAYVSVDRETIVKEGYEILDYGCKEPTFKDINGTVFVSLPEVKDER